MTHNFLTIMIQKYSQPNNYPRTTSEAHLPYCLTREYQMRVHAIAKNDTNDNR